jgi:structural maintenance of chromosome 1
MKEFDADIANLNGEIERMAPNMKAIERFVTFLAPCCPRSHVLLHRLDDVQARLTEAEAEADKSRKDSKSAREAFNDVKQRRTELFNNAYTHISERIDAVYKELTKGKAAPMGGVAYLSVEDSEEPYVAGVKYHAMPPMKRFRDMEQLSGGEKTIAALALLFAIHSYQPSPFFVLDEVDAALDNTNVAKIANYIRKHASESFQFVVISLKGSLYERGEGLVGIYRDQDVNSSRTLTLDVRSLFLLNLVSDRYWCSLHNMKSERVCRLCFRTRLLSCMLSRWLLLCWPGAHMMYTSVSLRTVSLSLYCMCA